MSPLATPLTARQQMHMDEVVLLTRDTSTGLGAGTLQKALHVIVRTEILSGVCTCVCLCVRVFTRSDVDSDGGAVYERLLLCSYCKEVESAWSQTGKHCALTVNLLHLEHMSDRT